jgi:hypothetical protein
VTQQSKSGLGGLVGEVSKPRTTTHINTHTSAHTHTRGINPLKESRDHRRVRYLYNTQQTQETNIHAFIGVRTRDTRNQEAADLRLRPYGHRAWQYLFTCTHSRPIKKTIIRTIYLSFQKATRTLDFLLTTEDGEFLIRDSVSYLPYLKASKQFSVPIWTLLSYAKDIFRFSEGPVNIHLGRRPVLRNEFRKSLI